MEVPGNAAGTGRRPEPPGRPPRRLREEATLQQALDAAKADLRELFAQGRVLLGVRADRARMAARRRMSGLALAAVAGIAGFVILVSGSLALVRGIAGGLTVLLGGAAWLGQLLTGILIVGGAVVGLKLLSKRREQREFEKRKAKYDELHRKEERRHAAAAAASNGGGAAGPGGAAGAAGGGGGARPPVH